METTKTIYTLEEERPGTVCLRRKYLPAIELVGSLTAVLFALGVIIGTGLYEGAAYMSVKAGLGVIVSFCYVTAFRHALYSE